MSTMNKIKMPQLTLDSVTLPSGEVIPGLKRMLDIALALKDSMMVWSGPGVGKSQSIMQWNAQKVREHQERITRGEAVKPWNPTVCDVRLSMKEPVDMQGIPIPTKSPEGTFQTVWAIPSVWPKDNDEFAGGTIFLDEMNQGQAAILNAAFQLVQDRALGEYKIPKGYLIVGAANPSAYNSSVTEFSIPLANRFTHFNVKADFESWLNHSLNNGGNVDVMSFLKTQSPESFLDMSAVKDKVGDEEDTMFTDLTITPRTWEVIGKLLALPKEQFSLEEKQRYATGRLGMLLTSTLFTYLKDKARYQSWQEILDEGKPFKDESCAAFWNVQMNCLSVIASTTDDKKCRQYVLNFIEATRKLVNNPYKVVNMQQLGNLERVKSKPNLYNPFLDAKDLVQIAFASLKR